MRKKKLFSVILVGLMVIAFEIGVLAERVSDSPDWDKLSAEYLDSFVGKVVIDKDSSFKMYDRGTIKDWKPYPNGQNINGKNGCVDYVCARFQEKLKTLISGDENVSAWWTGNGKDVATNAKSIDGRVLTAYSTGLKYKVKYLGTEGTNLKGNSWASFSHKTNSYGHVIYVEAVVSDKNGIQQVYYTECGNDGKLKKTSLTEFIGGTFGGGYCPKYLGAVCFDLQDNSTVGTYITPGTYNIVSALNSEKSAIDISAQSKDNKANLHLWERHTGDSQKFRIEKSGDYYEIINVNSGKALDVDGASNKNGTNVFQYNIQHSNNQQWSFEDAGNGYYYIKSRVGAYLDVSGGNSGNGTNIQVYQGNKTASQKFKLYFVSDSSGSTSTPVQPKKVPGSMTSSSSKSEYTTNEDIVIQWTTASGATEYGLTIKRDDDNWTAYDTAPGRRLTGNSANIGKLPAGTYRFNMCPYNSVGGGEVSELKRFTVKEAHTHSYTGSYYESAHPHKEYQLCTCGEKKYTGNTIKVAGCETCYPPHQHVYTSSYYESTHPHKEYQLCTCGDKRYTGNTRKDESCRICNPVVYTVYYNANGGSGAPAPQTHGENENVRLSSQTPTRDGYIFKGWAGSENGTVEMMPGDLCGYNYNVTFYAVWEKEQPKTVTLAFNAGGGIEPPSPRTVNAGTLVNIPGETPNRTGYRFMGWTDAAGSTTVKYEIGDVIRVSSDITLYAVWSSRTQLTLTIGNNWATVNGNQVYNDVAPLIVNDRTMLPARFVAENLGAKVEWVDRTQCVNITGSDNTYIQIFIGSATAYVDGEARYLDSPAFIRNDRTYTPVRFICEALGAEVGWNEALEQVNIIK